MGCNTSKLDDKGEIPVGLWPFRGRIEEIKRQRRVRNVSIVSTTELLRPEDPEGLEEGSMKNLKAVIIKEEMDVLPGSPSFRIYFVDNAAAAKDSDDDSVVLRNIKDAKLSQEKANTQAKECKQVVKKHGRENSQDSLISNEDTSNKPHKKERGRRFRPLTKVLAIRNCYGPGPTNDSTSNDSPRHHHALKST